MAHNKIHATFTPVLAQNRQIYKLLGYTNFVLSLFSRFSFPSCHFPC